MRNKNTMIIAMQALFLALLCILVFTPFGFIPLGPIKATIVHLPVIFMGITLGKKQGAISGFMMGCASLLSNTFSPGLISFAFSPFITIGGINGGILSLIICFVPRIILGLIAGIIGDNINNKNKVSIMAVIDSLIHSILVLSMIVLFFKEQYSLATGISVDLVAKTILVTFLTQSSIEAIIAGIFIYLIYPYTNKLRNNIKG